jgi:type IV fimbrial biogenesis protein FimT
MVVIGIIGILMTLGVPTMRNWIEDTKVRLIAEATHAGIQLARAEAIRLNELVRFQLTSDLTSGCALSSTASNWVVSLNDPTNSCDSEAAPQATILSAPAPRIIQTRSSAEGGGGAFSIKASGLGAAKTTLTFNGAGRLSGSDNIDLIEIPDPATLTTNTCQHAGGNLRCLRIRVLTGGDAVICDPKVTSTTDIRICP